MTTPSRSIPSGTRTSPITRGRYPDVAQRLHDRPDSIAVRVRVVWDRDGDPWLDGSATRWHGRHVFVRFSDHRSRLGFAWVDAGDVKRRPAATE